MKKIISLILVFVMCLPLALLLASCGESKPDAFVIMSEELDGLFNPYFSTTGWI